jgi:DNA-binding CsgD family transcriptional regulator
MRGAVAVLDRFVPVDGWCGLTLDPATLLKTGGVHESGLDGSLMPRLLEIEYRERDFVQFSDLARQPSPAASLHDATGGRPELSPRYRDVMTPGGYEHELRLVLRERGRVWGAFTFLRRSGSPAFTRSERELLAGSSSPLAAGVRRVLLRADVARGRAPEHSGLVLLDAGCDVVSINLPARQWFDYADGERAPVAVLAVAARVGETAEPASSRVWSPAGAWATLHAWRSGPDHVAVSVEQSRPDQLTALVLDAYGLSQREREVTQLVLLGESTGEIARRLHLSPYTVQDHLKSVFEKTGVRSRRALAAELFFNRYLPRFDSERRSSGWFADPVPKQNADPTS